LVGAAFFFAICSLLKCDKSRRLEVKRPRAITRRAGK
jgi:hypothetical protein